MTLEAMGRPTILVATMPFVALATELARSYGMPSTRIAEVTHPIGGLGPEVIVERAQAAVEGLVTLFGAAAP